MGPSGFSVRPLNSDVLHSSYMFFLLPLSFGFLSWAPHDGKYVQPEKQLPLAPAPRAELFFPSRLAWLRSGAGQEPAPAPELCQKGSKYMRACTLHPRANWSWREWRIPPLRCSFEGHYQWFGQRKRVTPEGPHHRFIAKEECIWMRLAIVMWQHCRFVIGRPRCRLQFHW